MDDHDNLLGFGRQGFNCAQMMMLKALELQGKDEPDVVRVSAGFAGGLGYTGGICGVLTGAVAVLSLYAGKGLAGEQQDPRLDFMVADLVKWFTEKYGKIYGGTECQCILGGHYDLQMERCPEIIISTFDQVKEILIKNGYDLSGMALDD